MKYKMFILHIGNFALEEFREVILSVYSCLVLIFSESEGTLCDFRRKILTVFENDGLRP